MNAVIYKSTHSTISALNNTYYLSRNSKHLKHILTTNFLPWYFSDDANELILRLYTSTVFYQFWYIWFGRSCIYEKYWGTNGQVDSYIPTQKTVSAGVQKQFLSQIWTDKHYAGVHLKGWMDYCCNCHVISYVVTIVFCLTFYTRILQTKKYLTFVLFQCQWNFIIVCYHLLVPFT